MPSSVIPAINIGPTSTSPSIRRFPSMPFSLLSSLITIKRQKALCELSALIERNEQTLKNQLNSEERKLFEKYLDGINEFNSLECCNEFLAGFRLGGRIVMEIIFGADDSELQD